MKFALKFSKSLKIAVSRENPGGGGWQIFFLQGGAGCFGGSGKNLLYRGGAEPLGGARNSTGG